MSFDLLADLDSFYQANPSKSTAPSSSQKTSHANDFLDFGFSESAFPASGQHGLGAAFPAPATKLDQVSAGDEDDFGDFESGDGVETTVKEVQHASVPEASGSIQPPGFDQQYYPRPTPLHVPETSRTKARSKSSRSVKPARDENVFFDAEEDIDDEEDVFDEPAAMVESVKIKAPPVHKATQKSQPVIQQQSLLDFDDEPTIAPGLPSMHDSVVNPSPEDDFEWSAFETSLAPATREVGQNNILPAKPRSPVPQTKKPSILSKPSISEADQAWDDFEVAEPSTQPIQNTHDQFLTVSSSPELPIQLPTMLQEAQNPSSTPPTNIPPPALLIPLFTLSITLAQTQLFSHLASTEFSPATRAAILSHPSTQTFLKSYLTLATVIARIIAGRKLRWKRDTILSQSMRIGAASTSGKSGGMKLTGVDKGENAREEREVADVLRLWRAQLGKLRSAITSTGTMSLPPIPELTETPVVRIAKEVDGGVPAPKQCVVCALKRNERVVKVDFEVEDVFGEWWLEHFGHKACLAFWFANEERLRSR